MASQLFAGTTYYVDATNGNDNNSGTSESNPWKTISKVNSMSFNPSDVILFKRGENWNEELIIEHSGTSGSPITFGAYGTGNRPKIRGEIWIYRSDYIDIDSFEVDSTGHPFGIHTHQGDSSHLKITNCIVYNSVSFGFHFIGDPGYESSDITVTDCTSYNNGYHGFKASQDDETGTVTISGVRFINCLAYNNGIHGFQASDGSGDISFINCTAYNNGFGPEAGDDGSGFRFGETITGLASGCHSYDNDVGIRIAGWTGPSPRNITVEGCDIHDNDYGIQFLGPLNWVHESMTIQRNKIHDNNVYGLFAQMTMKNGLCAYNLVYGNSDGGILWQPWSFEGGNSGIYNNVIANNGGAGLDIGTRVGVVIKNNILYQNSQQLSVASGTFDYNLYYPNVSFSRKGQHDISADPLFKDAVNHDYHLLPTSPCIDAGTAVGLTKDYAGETVPYGGGVDIGAYEYIGDYIIVKINANPTFGEAPLAVNFTGSATGGVPPYAFSWDFGDGQASSEQNPTHIYDETGGYTVVLHVTDSKNTQGRNSFFIYVSAPAPTPLPYLSCSPQSLSFGATISDNALPDQYFRIINAGGEILTWNIEDDAAWVSSSPASGVNKGKVTVSVNASGLPIGSYNSTITIYSPEAYNSPQYISVNLKLNESENESLPFGEFDTPIDGSTVSGIVPLSGWTLDEIEVTRVEIKRNPDPEDPDEALDSDGLVYMGDAIFIEEARPDIEVMYPDYPLNHRAGWGYALLTNSLPKRGNGVITIYAFAHNACGNRVEIGKKTIVLDNANRSKPFGAIVTPQQGENISGYGYINIGWALTPLPKTIPKDGSTIWAWIDGIQIGNAVYNQYQEDIALQYPEYNNAQGAEGHFRVDISQFEMGVHTIVWSAMDNWGEVDAIGMSYFSTNSIKRGNIQNRPSNPWSLYLKEKTEKLQIRVAETQRGYKLETFNEQEIKRISDIRLENLEERRAFRSKAVDKKRINNEHILRIKVEEMEPMRIIFEGGAEENLQYIGWGANKEIALPIGSTLNKEKGIFSWIPTPGFSGRYILHFAVTDGSYMSKPLRIVVNVIPKRYY